jgi:hypothetical protein
MAIQSLAKAKASMRDLKDRLAYRLAAASLDSIREANDAEGNPMLFCSAASNEAAGEPVIAFRISQEDAVSKDILGNDLKAYTPHKLEMAWEEDAISPAQLAVMSLEAFKIGMKCELKEIASGSAVSEANMDAADVAAALEFDARFPAKGM